MNTAERRRLFSTVRTFSRHAKRIDEEIHLAAVLSGEIKADE